MKKIYLIVLLISFLAFTSAAYAQSNSFRQGELSINPGLSLGVIGYGYGYYGSVGVALPVVVSVSYGVTENISAGAYLGYMGRSYGPAGFRDRLTVISFGAQGAFHASTFLNENLDLGIDADKWDLYAKVILGVETRFWTNEAGGTSYYSNGFGLRLGPTLGARYFFQPNLGLYVEGGRGTYGVLTLGLSLRL